MKEILERLAEALWKEREKSEDYLKDYHSDHYAFSINQDWHEGRSRGLLFAANQVERALERVMKELTVVDSNK